MFQRILVANRGEIALRVIRACRDLNVEVAVVYSEADRDAPYLKLADRAICIGPGPATESYLRIQRILAAAELANADAIHPGYGFLAENAHFAEVCRACDIEFIGPPEQAMTMLGNKDQAKQIARQAEVPIVPGSDGLLKDAAEARTFADRVGYPVLIKAAAGGGGKGMRVAWDAASLATGFDQAQTEAQASFNDSSIYLEKYLDRPRHVEVQLIADKYGKVLHLYERDCSMQRRHQKLVEESPAPNLPQEVRDKMCTAAVRLLQTAGYYSAGTCEFLVDKDFNFYFIEVNARIQVEHPVSELVTGIDLIREQIRVAAGEPLAFDQSDIQLRGAAIECRINAEDPANNFRPSAGTITKWQPPGGPGVRLDSHVCTGYRVPPNYDSMIAKLLVHQPTRAEAITVMKRALREFVVEGIKTTIPMQLKILETPQFQAGELDTTFIERELHGK